MFGGIPFLCRRAMDVMTLRMMPYPVLEKSATGADSPFQADIEQLLVRIERLAGAKESLRLLLKGEKLVDLEAFQQLRSIGVLAGESSSEARFRCGLYKEFLAKRLG
jgi:hypothetical protein